MEQYHFINQIKSFPFVEKIILFGSRARGDHSKKSDIDLAILCPTATLEDWITLSTLIEQADTLLKIDFVRLDLLPPNSILRKNILSEGLILYEKNKH